MLYVEIRGDFHPEIGLKPREIGKNFGEEDRETMKYTVKHACGHSQVHNLVGPGKERERKIAWLQGQVCVDCWKAGQRKAAELTTAQYDLPALKGTEKQVAWANQIRADFLKSQITRIENDPRTVDYRPTMVQALVEAVSSVVESARWIDNRYNLTSMIAPLYEQAYQRLSQS
jgi:hypothetical protein